METLPSGPGLGTFGKFVLLSELGRGGMGVVYEAHDRDLDRRVALKRLRPNPDADDRESAADEERFIREAQLSARLKHPHVVTVYEAGVIDGRRYLAMELIRGQPLSEWRKKETASIRPLVGILRDTALALHHAHERGVIHRDLKPANVLVDARNEPHVTDFGLAKLVGPSVGLSLTADGKSVGTPGYMSPEQVRGSKSVDARADVYSLGVMLYEILTGRRPFEGDTAAEIMVKSVTEPVKPPSKVSTLVMNPLFFTSLEAICLKAMAKDPGDRYPDARGLAEDLTRWLDGRKVSARAPGFRRRVGWTAGAAALLLVAGAIAARVVPPRVREPAATAPPFDSAQGKPAPNPALDPLSFEAGRPPREAGLRLRTSEEETCRFEDFEGRTAARPVRSDGRAGFFYLDVDDAWAAGVPMAEIEIHYFDAGPAWSNFSVEYDSTDGRWANDGTYKRAGLVVLEGSRKWRTVKFVFSSPRLENRMDLGADVRLGPDRADILVHRVELRPWTPALPFAGTPAAVPAERLRPGLVGEYHAGVELSDPRRRGVDPDLVFDWQEGSWEGGPSDQFSVRWTGGFRAPRAGRYLVEVQSDDGARVFLDGRAVVSNWTAHAPTTDAAICELEAGYYPLRVEYFEGGGYAYLRVSWFEERGGRMRLVEPPPFFHLPP